MLPVPTKRSRPNPHEEINSHPPLSSPNETTKNTPPDKEVPKKDSEDGKDETTKDIPKTDEVSNAVGWPYEYSKL